MAHRLKRGSCKIEDTCIIKRLNVLTTTMNESNTMCVDTDMFVCMSTRSQVRNYACTNNFQVIFSIQIKYHFYYILYIYIRD